MAERRVWIARTVVVFAVVSGAALAIWRMSLRGTPEALYRTRCSSCHPLADACRYGPRERGGIVHVMRGRHGAGALIDEEEARVISRYMREELQCP